MEQLSELESETGGKEDNDMAPGRSSTRTRTPVNIP